MSAPKEAGWYWVRYKSTPNDPMWPQMIGNRVDYAWRDDLEFGPPCRLDDALLRQRITPLIESWRKQAGMLKAESISASNCSYGHGLGLSQAADELERLLKGTE